MFTQSVDLHSAEKTVLPLKDSVTTWTVNNRFIAALVEQVPP